MKRSTVDLVVTGDEGAAVAEAVDAVRRGQRVLVVLRSDDARVVPRLRRLCRAAKRQLTVMTNAEVVCVDGVDGVEAVVVLRRRIVRERRARELPRKSYRWGHHSRGLGQDRPQHLRIDARPHSAPVNVTRMAAGATSESPDPGKGGSVARKGRGVVIASATCA
jgi:hypothetical protein